MIKSLQEVKFWLKEVVVPALTIVLAIGTKKK